MRIRSHLFHRQRGGVALEYILVSTFAAVVTMGALAYVGHTFKEQLERMGEKLGVEEDSSEFWDLPFGD